MITIPVDKIDIRIQQHAFSIREISGDIGIVLATPASRRIRQLASEEKIEDVVFICRKQKYRFGFIALYYVGCGHQYQNEIGELCLLYGFRARPPMEFTEEQKEKVATH